MAPSPIPQDPIYMTYIYNHSIRSPSPEHTSTAYRPATGLTAHELDVQGAKGVYQHFHRPFNDHSRFLTTATPINKYALRDVPRIAPPPWDGSTVDHDLATAQRPTSAPNSHRPNYQHERIDIGTATLLDNMTTMTGAPCYTVSAIIEADRDTGTPVLDPAADQGPGPWRTARVQTYEVPPSRVGYGEGGTRPFHQDYRHYKYYGFAGRGAKTSWAFNPKYSQIYHELLTTGGHVLAPSGSSDAPPAPPLHEVIGGPRRPLTAVEARLVPQFGTHSYGMEGVPSDPHVADVLRDIAAGQTLSPQQRWSPGSARRDTEGRTSGLAHSEIIEPFTQKVDILSRRPLPPDTPMRGNRDAARVTTYRSMASPYNQEYNISPQYGSQSPWHQRYSHYKQYGFAGRGASTSYARNPKYEQMDM